MNIGECTTGSIRLVNGTAEKEGTLEVCLLDHWNTACMFDVFSNESAKVACRQLGYNLDG